MFQRLRKQRQDGSISGTCGGHPRVAPKVGQGAQTASPPPANGLGSEPAWRGWKVAGICALLVVLVFVVFGQTIRFEFVDYDDNWYVYQNPDVIRGLTPGGVARAFTRKEIGLWNPLVTISHMCDCQLYGLWAGGHHLTNVLLHLASVILLFLILRQMTGALWRSAFVAAVFAIHPLNVESVAWVAERKDMLSGLFFMLTLGAWLHYVRRTGSSGRYLWVVLLYAMGLMCKLMLVTLPFVLLMLDYWPLNRLFQSSPGGGDPAKRLSLNLSAIVEKIPLVALGLGFCVTAMQGPKRIGYIDIEQVSLLTRICEAPVSFVVYLGQMIRPTRLAVIYTRPEVSMPWCLAALGLVGLLSAGCYLLRRKHPWLWTGWLWNLGMLIPVSGIVQISRHTRADHYNYLPQIGLYVGLTWLMLDRVGQKKNHRMVAGGLGAMILFALVVVACRQTRYWRDSITLWTHTLECNGDNAVSHNQLGYALFQEGRTEEAIAHYHEALRINPAYVPARSNLGIALFQQGQISEAIAQFHEALRIEPAYAEAHYNLGNVLLREKQIPEAIVQYREAVRFDPINADAHNNLGNALLQQGQTQEAIAQYREGLQINPGKAEARYNLSNALFQEGRTEEAIVHAQKALELQPANPSIQIYLAWMLAAAPQTSLRNGPLALELAMKASQAAGGGNPLFLRTLAAAYAEAGDFQDAVQTAQKALQLTGAQPNSAIAGALHREIKLYESGRRFEAVH
jgi:Flp pilus assembly protein TadD